MITNFPREVNDFVSFTNPRLSKLLNLSPLFLTPKRTSLLISLADSKILSEKLPFDILHSSRKVRL